MSASAYVDTDLETATENGHGERRIEVPMPPEFDDDGKRTANYGHEFKLAMWRERITDLIYSIQADQIQYRKDENRRHKEVLKAIDGRSAVLKAFWHWMRDSSVACIGGLTEITKAGVSNENGQLKWLALLVLGMGVIAYGGALTGLGFTISTADKDAVVPLEATP